VNTTSAPVTFFINGYGDPVTLSLPTNSNFVLSSGSSCPVSTQPCSLSVAFSPQGSGSFPDILTVTDTVTGALSTVMLSGTATP
jgi:hypothetical protein